MKLILLLFFKASPSTNPKLFQENSAPTQSSIVKKINRITDVVLRNNEYEVFNHFDKIDLSCHLFGIRWLRLLFLRELDFPSVLILWDAIFAVDRHEFNLVNFIFVSILSHLRSSLIHNDNSGCLQLLMKPLFHLNCLEVLSTALYYFNPAVS